jgi:hypothetical protein
MPASKARQLDPFSDAPDFDLEGLKDLDRREEGKDILNEAKENIANTADPKVVLGIFNDARERLNKLYAGTEFYQSDFPRFEKALFSVTRVRAGVGRTRALVKTSYKEEVEWRDLHDEDRKKQAIAIFEEAKSELLNCTSKNQIRKIYKNVEKRWESLYRGSVHRGNDIAVFNLKFGHLVIRRSTELE